MDFATNFQTLNYAGKIDSDITFASYVITFLYILLSRSRDNSVGIAKVYGLDERGFDSRQEQEIILYSIASRSALGPTQPPIQWVPGAPFSVVKRLEHKSDHSPPPTAEVKNSGAIPPLRIRLNDMVLSQLSTGTTLPFFYILLSGIMLKFRPNNNETYSTLRHERLDWWFLALGTGRNTVPSTWKNSLSSEMSFDHFPCN
jgi:hypothetical protein